MLELALSTAVAVSSLTSVAVSSPAAPREITVAQTPAASSATIQTPILRGIHMTGWAAGIPKARRSIIEHMKASGLNMVVIALKESDGQVFVRHVPEVEEIGTYTNAIPDLAACVKDFKDAGIYTVARLAQFKDNALARKRIAWAVHRPNGALWLGKGEAAWADPYRKEVWNYNLAIAAAAAKAGFDEIQFDYIRFPSDGPINLCRYSREGSNKTTAAQDLVDYLAEAAKRLHPLGVKLSIDVFGQTTTDDTGMGIGQHIGMMADKVDYVCPMMYPSHYYRGVYGIKDPNRDPYRTIHRALSELAGPLQGLEAKIRPYLQDFSLGHHYGPKEVRDQIFAAARMGVTNWTLWNPGNRYTWSAVPEGKLIETIVRSAAQEEQEEAAVASSTSSINAKARP